MCAKLGCTGSSGLRVVCFHWIQFSFIVKLWTADQEVCPSEEYVLDNIYQKMDSDLVLWKSEGNELAGHRNVKQQLMFLLSHRKMSLQKRHYNRKSV